MSRRRQIHHAQNVSAIMTRDDGIAPCAPTEALDWPEGTYKLARVETKKFRDKASAAAEVLRRYPGAILGKSQVVRGQWIFRYRLPEKGPTDAR